MTQKQRWQVVVLKKLTGCRRRKKARFNERALHTAELAGGFGAGLRKGSEGLGEVHHADMYMRHLAADAEEPAKPLDGVKK